MSQNVHQGFLSKVATASQGRHFPQAMFGKQFSDRRYFTFQDVCSDHILALGEGEDRQMIRANSPIVSTTFFSIALLY